MKRLLLLTLLVCDLGMVPVVKAQVSFKFMAQEGHAYHIQLNTELENRFWGDSQVVSNVTGQVNLSLPANGPMGFYRYCDTTGAIFWYGWSWHEVSPTLQNWGMGTSQSAYVGNDQPYDWYIDQGFTGPASSVNCGPSSATMACKWYNQNTSASAEGARAMFPEGNGWWYTYDVDNYLSSNSVPHAYYAVSGIASVTNLLAQGDTLIFCLNMSYIPATMNNSYRVQAFYSGVTGHFIVAKGYRVTDSATWIECYDPFDYSSTGGWGVAYSDGTPMGRDRHYAWANLQNAIANWWPYCIAVSPSQSQTRSARATDAMTKPVTSPPPARGQ